VFATSITYAGEPDPDPSDDGEVGDIWDGTEPLLLGNEGGLYFPWVGNDDESTGLGPADTSVSIMNINDEPAVAFAWVGSHDSAELPDTGAWDLVGPFFLAPWASKTFTAAQLGIAEGAGAPVAFAGYNLLAETGGVCETVLGGPLDAGNDVNGNGECTDVEVWLGGDLPYAGNEDLCVVDDANGDPAPTYGDIFGGPNDGLNGDSDCVDAEGGDAGSEVVYDPTVLGGYAKQAVDGENLPYTTAADSSVSGYNALGGFELLEFDDWYFPIAQTNCGPGGCWNTILRIANFGQDVNGEIGNIGSAAVTAAFFPADDAQGSLDTGFQLQGLLNTGDVWNIDISNYVPEGWVGSVHVYSDSAVFAMADRVKVGYGAWITNTASNAPHTVYNNVAGSASGQYVLFAPDVRLDFFGWNTGINVANLVNEDNNINIQYFNAFGNAPQAMTRRLAPQGMTYFYDPSIPGQGSAQDPSDDINEDVIGSALIWSDYPVAAAIDATKYPESTNVLDESVFQAMSYSATANVYTTQAFPLVQKGNPTDGMGATSGIQILNPNATAAQATVTWINPSGFGADNFGQSAVAIPGFAIGIVYTLTQGNLPNGFYGSAVLNSTVPVAAVTTQVDYAVEWDGTAVWNAYNPCGYYRDNGFDESDDAELAGYDGYDYDVNCNFGDPFNPQGGSVTKIVQDELGNPIPGVHFSLVNEAYYEQVIQGNESFQGIPWIATGYSSVNGEVLWTNVPVGTYYLIIDSVPTTDDNDFWGEEDWDDYDWYDFEEWPMYEGTGVVEGPFTLNEGEDDVIENVLDRILATKVVYLGDDAAGVEVCLHADDDEDGTLSDEEAADPEDCEVADEDGLAFFYDIEPGWYFISVNQGLEYDPVAGFNAEVYGPEYFGLGGIYLNDLSGDFDPDEGNLQKVLVLPEEICRVLNGGELAGEAPPECPGVSISGIIQFIGPDGELEAEGNVQTQFLDFIGPNDEPAFSMTDFAVPVGGPYTIYENITITYDLDGPGGDDPVEFNYETTLETAVDGQVVCPDYLTPSSECAPSPTDPDIYVFEDQTTRVFNDLSDIVTGQLDFFVRSDEDGPIEGAFACLFDEFNVLVECVVTDADGQAEFLNVPAGVYSLTATHPNYETDGTGAFLYFPAVDAVLGGGMDDELGDLGPDGSQQDIETALDPKETTMDIQTALSGVGTNGVTVFLFEADPLAGDVAGLGGVCLGLAVGADVSEPDEVDGTLTDGMTEFGVEGDALYCASADVNGDGIPTVLTNISVPEFDPDTDLDFVIDEGALAATVDVQYTLDLGGGPVPTNAVDIYLYISAAGDTSGTAGVCNGLPYAGPVATSNQLVSGQGNVDGIAEFPGVDDTLTYCASTSPIPGVAAPSEADINPDPADQADDIDGTIAEVNIVP
jgi:hypothetical protein